MVHNINCNSDEGPKPTAFTMLAVMNHARKMPEASSK